MNQATMTNAGVKVACNEVTDFIVPDSNRSRSRGTQATRKEKGHRDARSRWPSRFAPMPGDGQASQGEGETSASFVAARMLAATGAGANA